MRKTSKKVSLPNHYSVDSTAEPLSTISYDDSSIGQAPRPMQIETSEVAIVQQEQARHFTESDSSSGGYAEESRASSQLVAAVVEGHMSDSTPQESSVGLSTIGYHEPVAYHTASRGVDYTRYQETPVVPETSYYEAIDPNCQQPPLPSLYIPPQVASHVHVQGTSQLASSQPEGMQAPTFEQPTQNTHYYSVPPPSQPLMQSGLPMQSGWPMQSGLPMQEPTVYLQPQKSQLVPPRVVLSPLPPFAKQTSTASAHREMFVPFSGTPPQTVDHQTPAGVQTSAPHQLPYPYCLMQRQGLPIGSAVNEPSVNPPVMTSATAYFEAKRTPPATAQPVQQMQQQSAVPTTVTLTEPQPPNVFYSKTIKEPDSTHNMASDESGQAFVPAPSQRENQTGHNSNLVKVIPQQVVEVHKPKNVVQEVSRYVEVPAKEIVEKRVDIEMQQDQIVYKKVKQIIEVPKEVERRVYKPIRKPVQQIKHIPSGEVVEVPVPQYIEEKVVKNIYIDKAGYVAVAQTYHPVVTEQGVKDVECIRYEPDIRIVDINIPKIERKNMNILHSTRTGNKSVEIPDPHYNSLLIKLNPHIPIGADLPFRRDADGRIVILKKGVPLGKLLEEHAMPKGCTTTNDGPCSPRRIEPLPNAVHPNLRTHTANEHQLQNDVHSNLRTQTANEDQLRRAFVPAGAIQPVKGVSISSKIRESHPPKYPIRGKEILPKSRGTVEDQFTSNEDESETEDEVVTLSGASRSRKSVVVRPQRRMPLWCCCNPGPRNISVAMPEGSIVLTCDTSSTIQGGN